MFRFHQEYDPIRNGSMDGTDIHAHDHGLVRAYQNHCNCVEFWFLVDDSRKDCNSKCDPYRTLFVGRLKSELRSCIMGSETTTEETLMQTFSRYGKVKSLKLVRDIVTGCSMKYAFIEYYYDEDFSSAFFGAHRMRLDEAQILVDFMREQTVPGWVPRRFGGGVGGKKPSGQMRFGGRDCPFRAPFDINIYRSKQNGTNRVRQEEWGRQNESRELRKQETERWNEMRKESVDLHGREENAFDSSYREHSRARSRSRTGKRLEPGHSTTHERSRSRTIRRLERSHSTTHEQSRSTAHTGDHSTHHHRRSPTHDNSHSPSRHHHHTHSRSHKQSHSHKSFIVCNNKECSNGGSNPRPSRY